jgi:hypothetical protein
MVPTPSSTQRSPKKSPKRKILHERSQSQTNKVPQRIVTVEGKEGPHSTTPYPTKSAHVLLPSSIRSQDGSSGMFGASFATRIAKAKEKAGWSQNHLATPSTTNADTMGIKRSVSELRDLYESQVISPPSTIHSTRTTSRPTTAISSPALRGQTLGERLSDHGRFLPSESDEFICLPSPRDTSFSVKKVASETSLPPLPPTPPAPSGSSAVFAENPSSVRDGPSIASSSPNLIVLGSSSTVLDNSAAGSSSPNFVSLGHSSSQDFNSEPHIASPDIAPFRLASSPTLNPISPSSLNEVQTEESSSPRSESAATSSSPNVVTLRSSSPNYVTTKYDDSPDGGSVDSLRTIKKRRSEVVHEQPSTSTFSTVSEQFRSSPPNQEKTVVSSSTLDFPLPSEAHSGSAGLQQNDSLRAHEVLQTVIKSSPAPEIQYPVVSAPSMHTWANLNVQKRAPRLLQEDLPSPKWNPHLSTVPSEWEWSDENQLGSFHTLDTEDSSDTHSIPKMPQAVFVRDRNATSSTTSIIPEADRREATDMISDLRRPYLHNKASGFLSVLSGSSRSNSMRSIVLRRPNSSGSLNSTVRFPGWARRYYSRGPSDSFYSLRPETSCSNMSQASRPSTAITASVQQSSHSLFRPRTRAGKNPRESHLLPGIGPLVSNPSQPRLSSLPLDPADPRSHWAGAEQAAIQSELRNRNAVGSRFGEWSPHLHPDHRASGRNRWLAPSVDENGAPIFTWRDAHMLGFMLGFIFPISWFVAAFLPLPPKPATKEIMDDPEAGGPTLQEQLDRRTAISEEIRYTNLRWWRNLNRFMCVVGLVVIAIIVSYCHALIGDRSPLTW